MYKRAFTLMEIILVIVILGALGGLALPRFIKFMEIQRARNAINQMRLIVAAKDYLIQNRIACPAACSFGTGTCSIDSINSELGLDIHDNYFDYTFGCNVGILPGSSIAHWTIFAGRKSVPSSRLYQFIISSIGNQPTTIRCVKPGCAFIDMPATFPL